MITIAGGIILAVIIILFAIFVFSGLGMFFKALFYIICTPKPKKENEKERTEKSVIKKNKIIL